MCDKGVKHFLGFRPILYFKVMVLDSPAELTHMAAFIEGGRDLKTSVTLDTVEILFVAASSVYEALPHPMA